MEEKQAFVQVSHDKLSRYSELRKEAKNLYKTFGRIKCPALGNDWVHFTSEGFNHLIYRIKKQERHKSVQIMRFELLNKAKELLEKTTTVQEYEEYFNQLEVRMFKRKQLKNVKFCDWGFISIIGKFRIKVVVRKIRDGERKFHSVIPAWSTEYYRDIKIVRNTKGNVADD